ncbi:uncharacterized protein E0L32_011794 [Thyridium curvatum]|uniref:Uncharacterized protein n=1 Tax=Thyridium curvatum TaxID=1093900 RepID=A0A507BG07_9PEZI|nr:uncharacterized protein E0L32_011794 [Thyridium curvatum]TPX18296.1 hypothetical protein E0L32_011794 [Thyridium curvatum]
MPSNRQSSQPHAIPDSRPLSPLQRAMPMHTTPPDSEPKLNIPSPIPERLPQQPPVLRPHGPRSAPLVRAPRHVPGLVVAHDRQRLRVEQLRPLPADRPAGHSGVPPVLERDPALLPVPVPAVVAAADAAPEVVRELAALEELSSSSVRAREHDELVGAAGDPLAGHAGCVRRGAGGGGGVGGRFLVCQRRADAAAVAVSKGAEEGALVLEDVRAAQRPYEVPVRRRPPEQPQALEVRCSRNSSSGCRKNMMLSSISRGRSVSRRRFSAIFAPFFSCSSFSSSWPILLKSVFTRGITRSTIETETSIAACFAGPLAPVVTGRGGSCGRWRMERSAILFFWASNKAASLAKNTLREATDRTQSICRGSPLGKLLARGVSLLHPSSLGSSPIVVEGYC